MCAGNGGALGLIPPSEKTGLHLAGANRMGLGLGRKFVPARCREGAETAKNAGEIQKSACVRQENTQKRPQARIMRGLTTCGDLNGKEETDFGREKEGLAEKHGVF